MTVILYYIEIIDYHFRGYPLYHFEQKVIRHFKEKIIYHFKRSLRQGIVSPLTSTIGLVLFCT